MVTRLSASDAAFYHLENTVDADVRRLAVDPAQARNGLSYEALLATVEQRLPQIPRYRQKVREVTLGLARPVWVDDRDFDITYHIRRSALPSPGSDAQLHELIARLGSRPLDKSRPLWEMYLDRGPGEEPHRALHQVASGVGQRHDGAGDRPRHRRPHAEAAGVRRGHLDSGPRTQRPSPAVRRGGRMGHPARRAAAMRCGPRSPMSPPTPASSLDVGRRVADVARTVAARHRAEQPAEHHGVAQPAVHGRRPVGWRTTAWCGPATTATSTTSCWPWSPARCATGCCRAASR